MKGVARRLAKLRDIGVEGLELDHARRLRTINVITITAAVWTGSYSLLYAVYDAGRMMTEVGFLVVISVLYPAVFLFSRRGRVEAATRLLLMIGIVHLVVVSWLLGSASGVLNYLIIMPIFLTMVISHRDFALAGAVAVISSTAIVAITFLGEATGQADLPSDFVNILFVINVFGSILMATGIGLFFRWVIHRAEDELKAERARSDRLLRSMLPEAVVERLKADAPEAIADRAEATVLFADIVGFTAWAAERPPEQVVAELNRVFGQVDRLATEHAVEKIKTIGDAYFAVCGVPDPNADHAVRMAAFALDFQAAEPRWRSDVWPGLTFRIAIHSGPVVAGVIGRTKFAYDVWGDTVNTASRLQSACAPGEILITEATAEALGDAFTTEPLEPVELRGKGVVTALRLTGRR